MKKTDPTWNLKLLYDSPKDPRIERDTRAIEQACGSFAKKYDAPHKKYASDSAELLAALKSLEKIRAMGEKPIHYFWYLRDLEAENTEALSRIPLLENRLTKAFNQTVFFSVSLGKISAGRQKRFLADRRLSPYRVHLQRIFSDAMHELSVPEEKIMNLKSQAAYEMWLAGNEKLLNMQTVPWKGKAIPMAQASNMLQELKTPRERASLAAATNTVLREKVAAFSEAEINAVVTNKKIDDELRGFSTPYEHTVLSYRNDPKAVDSLVAAVTAGFPIAHRFFKLKAKILKLKSLSYADRGAKIGGIDATFPFDASVERLKSAFGKLHARYPKIVDEYVRNGQIDVPPRIGKTGGAYCSGSYAAPTFVLLNHIGDLRSYTTLAHEMGHAFHTELSKKQGPLYFNYSTALTETASTLFESIALDEVVGSLPEKAQAVILHDKIGDDIATIFRQVACFNFEKEIHETIRAKGFLSKEELADLHNKHMSAYLGPAFKLARDDGYFFVKWSHIRRFFYVYTYAYGMLVSKALLRRYRQDPSFWEKIEQFLSAGGSDSPEGILKGIGIDVASPTFWKDGLKAVEDDISRLEELVSKR